MATSRIFSSVFPPPSDIDLPTPTVTPLIPSSSTFDSPSPASSKSNKVPEHPGSGAAEQIKWDRAWHTATAFLSLPAKAILATKGEENVRQQWCKTADTETRKALEYVLDEDSKGRRLRTTKNDGFKGEDLLRWYFESQIVGHFMTFMRPVLYDLFAKNNAVEGIFDVGRHLYLAQMVYTWPVKQYMMGYLGSHAETSYQRLQEDIHGVVIRSLSKKHRENGLRQFFLHQASVVLAVDIEKYAPKYAQQAPLSSNSIAREMEKTRDWVLALKGIGFGGHQAQTIFAEVMDEILDSYVRATFSRKWESPSENALHLRRWIVTEFFGFITMVLEQLSAKASSDTSHSISDTRLDEDWWQDVGLHRLGALRTEELFSIVVEWDDTIHGAIEDLKIYVKDPTSRANLTNAFAGSLNRRLLQPGASTSEILQVYISIIRAFTLLDPRGVLLDRVARPVRRYLREREDTVSIVVSGLLANPEDSSNGPETLVDLAIEMSKQNSLTNDKEMDAELDFDDMEWMPDPVDASPEFKKSKHFDVIGSLISLFESKEIFIKEFQSILGERLLRKEHDFEREIRVLELLKLRFGEPSLQACEVMLRDILDSRRLDATIRKDQHPQAAPTSPNLHTRILSHLYWPSLHADTFAIPPEITALQERYAGGFEHIKQSRKLTWLHALGQVTVHLELEDRTITEEVQTWQASVIYAFQPSSMDNPSAAISRSIPDLVESLGMSESLVHQAITFWVGKLVLKSLPSPPNPPRTFAVLETLADEAAAQEGTTSAAIAAAAETATAVAAPAVLSEHEVAQEKMGVYAHYVIGMLTNGGAMPLQGIVMMLKMTVPGGFPFGNEELKGFLEGEVRERRLDYSGGVYKIKR